MCPTSSPGLGQSAADQQAAVAVERVGLRAHRRHSVPLRRFDQLRQPGAKFGRRRHLLVIRPALRIELRPLGASAERLAEKDIVDASPRERRRQGGLVEMRREARHRRRPHIGDRRHLRRLEQRQEPLERMPRMTDRQDRLRHVGAKRPWCWRRRADRAARPRRPASRSPRRVTSPAAPGCRAAAPTRCSPRPRACRPPA